MTKKNIDARVRRLQEYKKEIAKLQKEAGMIETELKADLDRRGVDELETENFTVCWKAVTSNRLDNKALKAALPDVYDRFTNETTCRRFSVA